MKDMFLKFCRMLLGILGVSAVSACGEGILPAPEYGPIMAEYGVPHADYVVSGKVTDEAGDPIKGIAVTAPEESRDTVFTADDGGYELRGEFFPDDKIEIEYIDVDDEDNGGYFASQTKSVALEKQKDGTGWYSGLYAAFGVDVMMEEAMECEYGVPYATFEVKGKVVDADGNPIAGIEVYGEDIHEHIRAKTTTSEDGSFTLVQPEWFPAEEVDVCLEDVDGEANGGDFGKKVETVSLTQTAEGNGHWNFGVYSSDDLTITM